MVNLAKLLTEHFVSFYKEARKAKLPRKAAIAWSCFAVNELFIQPIKSPPDDRQNTNNTLKQLLKIMPPVGSS